MPRRFMPNLLNLLNFLNHLNPTPIKVSIQIPTYNQRQYILSAVESALAQDYAPLEVLVSDDCSTDDTGGILQNITDQRFIYRRQPVNLGRIANYHETLYKGVSGEWVVNLDGDDHFSDRAFISYAVSCIHKAAGEKIVLFQGNHDIAKLKKIFPQHTAIDEETILVDGPTYFINYYKVQRFKHFATLYHRATALGLNFYSFDCLFTDFNSMAKLFLQGKLLLSGRKVAEWRLHGENQSSGLNEKNIEKEMASIDDLAAFAGPYFKENAIENWRNRMKAYMVTTYIELRNQQPRSWGSLVYLLKNFKWDMVYFKQLFRWFFRFK